MSGGEPDAGLMAALDSYNAAREAARQARVYNKHAMRHPGRLVEPGAEADAMDVECLAFETVVETPATTAAGLAAKVEAIATVYPPGGISAPEGEWSRSVWRALHDDIQRVCGAAAG